MKPKRNRGRRAIASAKGNRWREAKTDEGGRGVGVNNGSTRAQSAQTLRSSESGWVYLRTDGAQRAAWVSTAKRRRHSAQHRPLRARRAQQRHHEQRNAQMWRISGDQPFTDENTTPLAAKCNTLSPPSESEKCSADATRGHFASPFLAVRR